MQPWRAPWFVDALAHVSRWPRGAWRVILCVAALGVGAGLASLWQARSGHDCPNRWEQTRAELMLVEQTLQLSGVQARDPSCAGALAHATAAGRLHERKDGWGRPLQLRCLGETMVLRSTGPDLDDEWDDLVLVRPRH